MKKSYWVFVFMVLKITSVMAQSIALEFPYLKGNTYEFHIFQGEKRILLKEDTIRSEGKVKLVIPNQYKGYKGMGTWYLTNSKTGGGLDLIINNENFSVSCHDSVPTATSILYKNTQEQEFSNSYSKEQDALFQKHDAMLAAMRAYPKESVLYPTFETEYATIVKEYAAFSKKLSESPFYAAKFLQIVNLTRGIGTILSQDEIEKANNINSFIVNDLDYAVLYTSNHWGGIISSWVQLQSMVIKDDAKLVEDTKTILHRLPNDEIYTDFVSNLTKELSRIGKDAVLSQLTPKIKKSNRLLRTDGVLSIYKHDLSGTVPDLIITKISGQLDALQQTKSVIKTTELKTKYTLLLFYQSGCGHCEEAIAALEKNYKKLVAKGFRIISMAADTDFAVYSNTSFALPWADKYCDLKGMEGINFQNYAVIGTPTLLVLDKKGKVILKPVTVPELLEWQKITQNN